MVVGGEYIHKMDDVMRRVEGKDQIGDQLGFRYTEAVFVFLPEKYPMSVYYGYGKDYGYRPLSPTMVKRVLMIYFKLILVRFLFMQIKNS